MELTNREQEALNVVKAAGPKGIGFKDWQRKAGVKGHSTMRQRIGRLVKLGVVTSALNGKFATYTAVVK